MHIRTLIIWATSFVAPISLNTAKTQQPTKLTRSFTLTPGYMERTFNSNEMMVQGPLSLAQLATQGFDSLLNTTDNVYGKLALGGLYVYPYFLLANISNTVYHEFGHARAFASVGTNYIYGAASASSSELLETNYAYGIYPEKLFNPSHLFDGAYTKPLPPYPQITDIPKAFFLRVSSKPSIQKVITKAHDFLLKIDAKQLTNDEALSPTHGLLYSRVKLYYLGLESQARQSLSIGDYMNGANAKVELPPTTTADTLLEKIYSNQALSPYEDLLKKTIDDERNLFDIYATYNGLNNQMRYSQEIANLIYKSNGHLLYFLDHLEGKLSAFYYILSLEWKKEEGKVSSGNDINNILNAYAFHDFKVTENDIKFGSLASLFLSSTTWAFVYSAVTELPKGSFVVYAPVWKGWRLPDLNFYLTTQGLSFEVVTGYEFTPSWYVGLNAEAVYIGNTAYEISPSIAYRLPTSYGEWEFGAQLHISDALELGGNTSVEWTSPNKSWSTKLKYLYHNALTLVGERNIPFFKSGFLDNGALSTTNHEVALTLSYNY